MNSIVSKNGTSQEVLVGLSVAKFHWGRWLLDRDVWLLEGGGREGGGREGGRGCQHENAEETRVKSNWIMNLEKQKWQRVKDTCGISGVIRIDGVEYARRARGRGGYEVRALTYTSGRALRVRRTVCDEDIVWSEGARGRSMMKTQKRKGALRETHALKNVLKINTATHNTLSIHFFFLV